MKTVSYSQYVSQIPKPHKMVRMRIIQTFLLICMILPWARATGKTQIKNFYFIFILCPSIDVVCGNKTSDTVLIGKGDSFSFKTQAGPTYQPNTKCLVKYKVYKKEICFHNLLESLQLRKSCTMMKFFCPLFDIENKKQNCKKPDRITIVADGKSKQ